MSEPIDHVAEAIGLRQLASAPAYAEQHGNLLAAAQVHATLALVEQQRYANLIAFMVQYESDTGDNVNFSKFHAAVFSEITKGIGLL